MADKYNKKKIKAVGDYCLKLDEKSVKQDEISKYYQCYQAKLRDDPLIAKSIFTADFPKNIGLIKMLLSLEYKRFKQINDPYIVKILNFLETSKNIYMILENFDGTLLEHITQSNADPNSYKTRKLKEGESLMILEMIVDAMISIHSKKIIHCDLKPSNFVFKNDENDNIKVMVMNFILAKFEKESSPINSKKNGTPAYMAPEVWNNDTYDEKVDVWSVGIIFYQLLAGKVPFEHESKEELEQIIQNQRLTFNDLEISLETQELLKIMLQKDPKKRADFQEIWDKTKEITNGEKRNSLIESMPGLRKVFEKNSKILDVTKKSSVFKKYRITSHISEEESKESMSPIDNKSGIEKKQSTDFNMNLFPVIEEENKNQLIKESCHNAEMYFEYEKKLLYVLKTIFDDFGKYVDLKSEEDKFCLGVTTLLLNKLWMILMKKRIDKFEQKKIDNNFSEIFYNSDFFQTLQSQLSADFMDESDSFESWCEEILELTPKIANNKEIKLIIAQGHESNLEFEQIYMKYISQAIEYLKVEKEKIQIKYKKEYMILVIELNYCKSEKTLLSEFPFDQKEEVWTKKFLSFDELKSKKDKELENMIPK